MHKPLLPMRTRFPVAVLAVLGFASCGPAKPGSAAPIRPPTSGTAAPDSIPRPNAAAGDGRLALVLERVENESGPQPTTLISLADGAQLISLEAAPAARVVVGLQPGAAERIWLKLDDQAARPAAPGASVTLASLNGEFDALSAGHHRLLAFASANLGSAPSAFQELPFEIGTVPTQPPQQSISVQVFAPSGTFNGAYAAASAKLCFSTQPPRTNVSLKVSGPEGNTRLLDVESGVYLIRGLVSGDYSLEWFASAAPTPSTAPLAREVITVNLDAPDVGRGER